MSIEHQLLHLILARDRSNSANLVEKRLRSNGGILDRLQNRLRTSNPGKEQENDLPKDENDIRTSTRGDHLPNSPGEITEF